MPLKNVLPINPVVNVIVNLSTISAPRKAFNLACLMGDVGSVADFSAARVVTYDSLEAMLQAGFKTSDRLYQAASLLLGQQKKPPLNDLKIFDYNGVIKDLNGYSKEEFIAKIKAAGFAVEKVEDDEIRPRETHEFSMFLDDK